MELIFSLWKDSDSLPSSSNPKFLLYTIATEFSLWTFAKTVSNCSSSKANSRSAMEALKAMPVPSNSSLPIKRPA